MAVSLTGLELSGLVRVRDRSVLDQRGWEEAFWSACDERLVHEALVLVGHPAGVGPADGWEVERLRWPSAAHDATDAEALAYQDGAVFVVGSQFGSKSRFLAANRAFVARFEERDALGPGTLQVAQQPFRLHRAINDALRDIPLLELSPDARRRFVDEVRRAPANAVLESDHPINVEGLALRAGGTALLGLRYPVAEGGHPIVVELEDFARAAFEARPYSAAAVRVLSEIGSPARPLGIRDLDYHEAAAPGAAERVSIVVGATETDLLAGRGGKPAPFEHWTATFGAGGPPVMRRVRVLSGQGHVEGVALRIGRAVCLRDGHREGERDRAVARREPGEPARRVMQGWPYGSSGGVCATPACVHSTCVLVTRNASTAPVASIAKAPAGLNARSSVVRVAKSVTSYAPAPLGAIPPCRSPCPRADRPGVLALAAVAAERQPPAAADMDARERAARAAVLVAVRVLDEDPETGRGNDVRQSRDRPSSHDASVRILPRGSTQALMRPVSSSPRLTRTSLGSRARSLCCLASFWHGVAEAFLGAFAAAAAGAPPARRASARRMAVAVRGISGKDAAPPG